MDDPGPEVPIHAEGLPVIFASTEAAKAAPSSCLTCTYFTLDFLIASTKGSMESPGIPYIL